MGLIQHRLAALLAGAAICVALVGCSQTTQTTSGREYLSAYAQEAGLKAAPMSAEIKAAAAVEPLLRFPARIGLARISNLDRWHAQLTGIPEQEAAAWQKVAASLGPKFGEFVPVSPLVAEMFDDRNENTRGSAAREVVRKIQLGAARQHLDAVVIYESDGTADSHDNPLSIGEWTLIGAFILPSQDVKARGVAQAMMIDVRNGYPYGTAQVEAKDAAISTRFSTGDSERDLAESARLAAVESLAPEVEKMMRNLRVELAEARDKRRGK
jgi:hypothetical protein